VFGEAFHGDDLSSMTSKQQLNGSVAYMVSDTLREYIAACVTGIWIESHEHPDAISEIA